MSGVGSDVGEWRFGIFFNFLFILKVLPKVLSGGNGAKWWNTMVEKFYPNGANLVNW